MTPDRLKALLGECRRSVYVPSPAADAYRLQVLALGEALEAAWKERDDLKHEIAELRSLSGKPHPFPY